MLISISYETLLFLLSNLRLFSFQLVRETTRQDNVPIQNRAVRQPPQVCAHFAAADRPFAFVVGRGAEVATLGGGDEQDAGGLGLAHKCKLVRVRGPKITLLSAIFQIEIRFSFQRLTPSLIAAIHQIT